ncbi:MAG TPA: RNA degradosome polyphosphate kinase, partial [Candidatus Bathyarchaeia archaeon]|nr:RNA degradosome polyphosphate kinase [Candidatus Bathyarchaeia archaeon]
MTALPGTTASTISPVGRSRSGPAAARKGRAAQRETPNVYINRELSWLEYSGRVLYEAADARNPLLERVRFMTIFASMLDEFFQIRMSGLRQQVA